MALPFCCVLAVTHIKGLSVYSDDTCKWLCGPECYGYGNVLTAAGTSAGCGYCLSPVLSDCAGVKPQASAPCLAQQTPPPCKPANFSSVQKKPFSTAAPAPFCVGQTCLVCNGTSLDMVPAKATVYITHDCSLFLPDNTKPATVELQLGQKPHVGGLTLMVQKGDTVKLSGPTPLVVYDSFVVAGAGTVHMNVSSGTSAIIVESKRRKATNVNIGSHLIIDGVSDCALTFFSDVPARDITGNVVFAGTVTFAGTTTPVYLAAIANVIGGMQVLGSGPFPPALVLDVNGESFFVPDNVPVISVSKMLGVFGKNYEIAYVNDGDTATATPFVAANRVLVPTAAVLLFLWFTNPTFGTGDLYYDHL